MASAELPYALGQICNAEIRFALKQLQLIADVTNLRRISERPSDDLRYSNYFLDFGRPGQLLLFSVRVVLRTQVIDAVPQDMYCAEVIRRDTTLHQLLREVGVAERRTRFLNDADRLNVQSYQRSLLEEDITLSLAIVDSFVLVFTVSHGSGYLSKEEEHGLRLRTKAQFLYMQKIVLVHNLSARPKKSVSPPLTDLYPARW